MGTGMEACHWIRNTMLAICQGEGMEKICQGEAGEKVSATPGEKCINSGGM